MFKLRMIGKIIRYANLGYVTMVYAAVFVGCALAIAVLCPEVGGFGNALWLCFQTATTIGFGDTDTSGFACRVLLVVVSVVSVFYLAVITGVVVAYCTQLLNGQAKNCLHRLVDDLEHLDGKTPEELRDISRRAREYTRGRDGTPPEEGPAFPRASR